MLVHPAEAKGKGGRRWGTPASRDGTSGLLAIKVGEANSERRGKLQLLSSSSALDSGVAELSPGQTQGQLSKQGPFLKPQALRAERFTDIHSPALWADSGAQRLRGARGHSASKEMSN